MDTFEKLTILEEMLGIDEGTLKEDTILDDVAEWDSMAVISLIAVLDDKFGKTIPLAQIRKLKNIKDILELME